MQTVRSRVVRRTFPLEAEGSVRSVYVPMDDGTGDRLHVALHTSRFVPQGGAAGGLALLVHGLGGSSDSSYVNATAYGLLKVGYNVARIDLRGAGLSQETCSKLYHAGRTEDLRTTVKFLAEQPEATDNLLGDPRIAVLGFSLGGALTLKLFGEPHAGLPLFAGVTVSAPIDLVAGSEFLRHAGLGIYEKVLVSGLKKQTLAADTSSGDRISREEVERIKEAKSLSEFDDVLTAPRNGWRDSAHYYTVNSSNQFLPRIDVPTLVIHSLDDPMVASMPYRAVDWDHLEGLGYVEAKLTDRGGHVGFHERGADLPWFVGQSIAFLARF